MDGPTNRWKAQQIKALSELLFCNNNIFVIIDLYNSTAKSSRQSLLMTDFSLQENLVSIETDHEEKQCCLEIGKKWRNRGKQSVVSLNSIFHVDIKSDHYL